MKGKQVFTTEHPSLAFEELVKILKENFDIHVYDDHISEHYCSDYSFVVSDVELDSDELQEVCEQNWNNKFEQEFE